MCHTDRFCIRDCPMCHTVNYKIKQILIGDVCLRKKKENHIIFNPVALRKAKIIYHFGLSECKGLKFWPS